MNQPILEEPPAQSEISHTLREQIRETYNIQHWSDGYFDISEQGTLVAYPNGKQKSPAIDMAALIETIEQAGLSTPVLVRFTDILKSRFGELNHAFAKAIQEYHYQGQFTAVYPIKVNQQRRVVERVIQHGAGKIGLEAGSKPELLAVIGLSQNQGSTIICNGYKDREFIRLALISQSLGHKIYIIIEKLSELDFILQESRKIGVEPQLGVRVRLASTAASKWQDTGGERSKFGFSANQLLKIVDHLKEAGALKYIKLIHFHLGSQIANIGDIQRAMRECARHYVELRRMDVPIEIVDVGGGLGVDYEGTHSRSHCSMNYSIQEYANNIVYTLAEVCKENQLPHPNIITESGRAMTAHHAVLITNVIEVEETNSRDAIEAPMADSPQILQDMWYGLCNVSEYSALEMYHDVCYHMGEINSMYTHGIINLQERAKAEQIYLATCAKVRDLLKPSVRVHREIIDELNAKLADKYYCNFSLFQSLPDAWAINQIFPILPISGLTEIPKKRGTLHDITCDSDGCLDAYVDSQGVESTLPLLPFKPDQRYLLGIFLVGAYQEILGDLHNLFGDTNSVHIELLPDGSYDLIQPVEGDTVESVLRYVHFDAQELLQSYRKQLSQAQHLTQSQRQSFLEELRSGLQGYTYLEE